MEKFQMTGGNSGFYLNDAGVVTFDVQGVALRQSIAEREYSNLYSRYIRENHTMQVGGYTVPTWGEGHNLYPQEIYDTISDNKLLPEILQKQVDFLFGKGPCLYRNEIDGQGKNTRMVRVPVQDDAISRWLDSWENSGFDHHWDYLINQINEFYHANCCISQYHFTKARRIDNAAMPVMALSHIDSTEARKATSKTIAPGARIRDKDCDYIMTGNWLMPTSDFELYHRFNPMRPFANPTAISWVQDKTFGKEIYPCVRWFKGLKEWIKGSNLNPKYINSYLKNALNAHVHVIIPGSWYSSMKGILEEICSNNLMAGDSPVTHYKGVCLLDGKTGAPVAFNEIMMEELIAHQLRQITQLLSGEGENQGKLWASTKWGEDGWEFKEFPGKFKEYFESVIAFDKRCDQVILAGKGINASITNVEQDGIISKSGSDVLYNYLIYSNSLTIPEYFVTKDINRAIRMNFPHAITRDIKLGFRIEVPAKTQDTTPSDRLENNI